VSGANARRSGSQKSSELAPAKVPPPALLPKNMTKAPVKMRRSSCPERRLHPAQCADNVATRHKADVNTRFHRSSSEEEDPQTHPHLNSDLAKGACGARNPDLIAQDLDGKSVINLEAQKRVHARKSTKSCLMNAPVQPRVDRAEPFGSAHCRASAPMLARDHTFLDHFVNS
jgi:hypothetical protein